MLTKEMLSGTEIGPLQQLSTYNGQSGTAIPASPFRSIRWAVKLPHKKNNVSNTTCATSGNNSRKRSSSRSNVKRWFYHPITMVNKSLWFTDKTSFYIVKPSGTKYWRRPRIQPSLLCYKGGSARQTVPTGTKSHSLQGTFVFMYRYLPAIAEFTSETLPAAGDRTAK